MWMVSFQICFVNKKVIKLTKWIPFTDKVTDIRKIERWHILFIKYVPLSEAI